MKALLRSLCVLVVAITAFGQTDRGTLTGVITDPTGAVVPNAAIEVKNSESGAVFQGGTSATGNYTFSLPRGTYELTVIVSGFKKYVRQNLELNVATTVRWDAKLEVGATSEAITVNEVTPLLKTESAEVSHNVASERANTLPLLTLTGGGFGLGNIRNPLQVVNLLAGASFGTDFMVRINGMPANTQAIRIEGQDATNGIWKEQTQIAQSGLDAIQEVAIQTSNYSAEFGQAGGGYFNFTMKSGTNQFHGTGYSYLVNEVLNAGTPNTNAGSTNSLRCYKAGAISTVNGLPTCAEGEHTRNRLRRVDYGFTVGGPIILPKLYDGHDRSFFFFNFEQFREARVTATGLATVPNDAYRSGDFTQAGTFGGAISPITWTSCAKNAAGQCIDARGNIVPRNGIYDPLTTNLGPDGSTYRTLFAPFNVVPKTRLDPVALAVQDLLPKPLGPNATNLINNYNIPAYTNFRHTSNPSIKIDHSISSTIKVSGYMSQTTTRSPNNTGFVGQPFNSSAEQDDVSRTLRVNYDHTVTPTLLLHLGAGYLWTYNPTVFPAYDPAAAPPKGIGLIGFEGNIFPNLNGGLGAINDITQGGESIALGAGGGFPRLLWEQKPTGNAYLTWIKNNHTFKLGLDLTLDGFVHRSPGYANGNISFTADTTGLPAQYVNPIAAGRSSTTGFGYASFLLGQVTSENVSGTWAARIGNRAIGMYIQDTWKVTRKLTLDYGLRYDYQTYLKETYGRLINVSLDTPNPAVGGRLGAVIFEGDGPGRCKCTYGSNYPYAIGPRIGVAYQINSKTVLRMGGGLSYGTTAENAQLSYNIGQAANVLQPGQGFSAWPVVNAAGNELMGGNPFRAGNPYGNTPITWPNFDPGQYPTRSGTGAATLLVPSTPLTGNFDRNLGRPPRILSWSVGLQREVMRNLVVEASYVANRGVWWTAPVLQDINQNTYKPSDLLSRYGLDITKSVTDPVTGAVTYPDQLLLTSLLNSTTAINRGFAKPAYTGMPLTQTVAQQLRPYPQFGSINPFLGPPLGDTWYDSLQTKVTKRYSHGLDIQGAFTWQKELALGSNSSTSYFTPGRLGVNDIFNRSQNKTISSLSQPFQLVISGSYTTPIMKADGMAFKFVSQILRDWQIGAVLRYTSGAIIPIPVSANNLFNVLQRVNNFAAPATTVNRNPGVPLFVLPGGGSDPNCKCFDPNKDLLINRAAFTDAPSGQFGTAAPFYNDFRWMRQPSEAMNFGRNFRMGREGKYNLQIRAEFQNVLNRRFYSMPAGFFGAPQTINVPTTTNTVPGNPLFGSVSGGLGYVNAVNGAGSTPRSGQMVARFTF